MPSKESAPLIAACEFGEVTGSGVDVLVVIGGASVRARAPYRRCAG